MPLIAYTCHKVLLFTNYTPYNKSMFTYDQIYFVTSFCRNLQVGTQMQYRWDSYGAYLLWPMSNRAPPTEKTPGHW